MYQAIVIGVAVPLYYWLVTVALAKFGFTNVLANTAVPRVNVVAYRCARRYQT